MRSLGKAVSVPALALALSVGVGYDAAVARPQPARLACGAVLTADTTLTRDLLNCPDNGLVVGADDITVDLNGHTVAGNRAAVDSCPDRKACDVGIVNYAGHSGVTVTGGSVRGFAVGVLVSGATRNRLARIRTSGNADFGIVVADTTRSRIDHNTSVDDQTCGIVVIGSRGLRLDHNAVSGAHGYAIPLFGTQDSVITQNSLDSNDHGLLLESSKHNEVVANTVTDSAWSSIDLDHSTGNLVVVNTVRDNGGGVVLFGSSKNSVRDNSITGTDDFGVIVDGSRDNLVIGNDVRGGQGPGILVQSLESTEQTSRNIIRQNSVSGRGDSGITVGADALATLLERNVANGNGADGIHIESPSTTVTRNAAHRNHGLGIDAVTGVTDGGGNRARGNGNPIQCRNVVCR